MMSLSILYVLDVRSNRTDRQDREMVYACNRSRFNIPTCFPKSVSSPGKSIWCMLLDRPQQKLTLISLPLEYFTEITNGTMTEEEEEEEEKETQTSSMVTVLATKTSDTWINVGYWLAD